MPRHPDSLNCRPGWTSSSTVTCGLSTCTVKRGHTSSTTGLFSAPLPGPGSPLVSLTIPGKGGTPRENPPSTGPRTWNHTMPMMSSSTQRSSRRATPSWRTTGTPRARCAILAAFSQRCTMMPDWSISLWVNPNLVTSHKSTTRSWRSWSAWHMPAGMMPTLVGIPYHSAVSLPPYRRCTPWRSYELLVSSLLWLLQPTL